MPRTLPLPHLRRLCGGPQVPGSQWGRRPIGFRLLFVAVSLTRNALPGTTPHRLAHYVCAESTDQKCAPGGTAQTNIGVRIRAAATLPLNCRYRALFSPGIGEPLATTRGLS